MHMVWTEILHPAHFFLEMDFCCSQQENTECEENSSSFLEPSCVDALTHQGPGHAVLFSNVTEVSRTTGLKPDVVSELGIFLQQRWAEEMFFPEDLRTQRHLKVGHLQSITCLLTEHIFLQNFTSSNSSFSFLWTGVYLMELTLAKLLLLHGC